MVDTDEKQVQSNIFEKELDEKSNTSTNITNREINIFSLVKRQETTILTVPKG